VGRDRGFDGRDGGGAADPVLLRGVPGPDGRFNYPIEQR
jgi:hypothetical protein